jgi:hypothetical protein
VKFAFNDRVWDKKRRGPALVLDAGPDGYKVAEILSYLRLGRLAERHEDDLDHLVEVAMPASEVRALLSSANGEETFPDYLEDAAGRLLNLLEEVIGEEP